jgi:hypothetical protein
MSYRLQVLIPIELNERIQKASKRAQISKGEWVRRALEAAMRPATVRSGSTVAQLAALNAPTAPIHQMLSEIEAGRR